MNSEALDAVNPFSKEISQEPVASLQDDHMIVTLHAILKPEIASIDFRFHGHMVARSGRRSEGTLTPWFHQGGGVIRSEASA